MDFQWFGGVPEVSLGLLWALFGLPLEFLWAPLCSLWNPLGSLGPIYPYLEALWGFFWVSLGSFGPPFGRCGALFDVINASL